MIGDVLASSILFKAIKHQYPNAELHYLINTHTFPVVDQNPYIDKIQFFTPEHEKNKLKLFKLAKQLRKENYDVIIDVYSKLSSNLIALFSKAKIKVSKHKEYTSLIYSHTYKDSKTARTNAGLAIENRLQLLEPLKIDTPFNVRPKIYLTKEEESAAKAFLESNNIDTNKPLYMISVLGSGSNKTYPFDYMASVIDTIVTTQPKSQILFNYIPKQEADAKAILNLCAPKTQDNVHFNVFGKSLRDFLAITQHCDALIGNEGGAINMAKALSIPTFTIFSPWIKKEAWNMFDEGIKHVSVHLKDYDNQPYLDIKHPKELKSQASELYLKFKPSLFEEGLVKFLERL